MHRVLGVWLLILVLAVMVIPPGTFQSAPIPVAPVAGVSPAMDVCKSAEGWSEIQRPLSSDRDWPPQHGSTHDYITHVAPSVAVPGRIYAGGEAGAYRSDDCGVHWRILRVPNDGLYGGGAAVIVDRYDRLYVMRDRNALRVSDDGGDSWRQPLGILPDGRRIVNLLAFVPAVSMGPDATAITSSYADYGAMRMGNYPIAIWESTDAGATFTPIGGRWKPANGNEGLADDPRFTAIDPRDPMLVYAVTKAAGAFRSHDRGLTWEPFVHLESPSSSEDRITQIEVSTSGLRIWLLTSQGWLFTSLDDGVTWTRVNELPQQATLQRVAANPHDPSSVFGITKASAQGECCQLWFYRPSESQ